MDERSLLNYLQWLGLGNTSPWIKALPNICGGLGWPSANILATADALWLAMGESPPRNAEELSQADHLLRTRVSQLKSKAGKKWLQSGRGYPIQVLYALTFRISASDHTCVLFIFEQLLAEHIWANIIDPVTGNSYDGQQKDRRFAEEVVEGYYGFPLAEMRHKGLDIGEGVWQFPFGTGHYGREQLTESLVKSVTRGPSATTAKKGPRFVGLWGFSGIGKTTLARRVKEDRRVKERFGNRVFWLTLGRTVSPDTLEAHKADICARLEKATLHGKATLASTVQRKSLRELSEAHPFLLVLDDLYSAAQAKAFRQLERECCILATSKSRRVLEDVNLPGSIVPIPPLSEHEAHKMFNGCTGSLPEGSSALRNKLVALCAGIPLAIKIAGLMIRRTPAHFAAVTALLETELDGIKAYDPDFTDGDASAHGGQTILAAVIGAATRDFLTTRERDALLRLSVVPRKTKVPYEALKTFWSTDAGGVDVLADALADVALVEKDSDAQCLSLHDMIHTYLIGRARRSDPAQGERPLKEYHKDLLRAYAEQCVGAGADRFEEGKTIPWWNHPGDGYFYHNLAFHLSRADCVKDLHRLLFNYRWLRRKLELTDVDSVLDDFQHCGHDEDVFRLRRALEGARDAVNQDEHQLPGQLIGRLETGAGNMVRQLVEDAAKLTQHPWLRPLNATLDASLHGLMRTLRHNDLDYKCLALSIDGRLSLWRYQDTLELWEHVGGVLRWCRESEAGEPTTAAFLPNANSALVGYRDGLIRSIDLTNGSSNQTLTFHAAAITTMACSSEGAICVSGDRQGTFAEWVCESGKILCSYSLTSLDIPAHLSVGTKVLPFEDMRVIFTRGTETIHVFTSAPNRRLFDLTHTNHLEAIRISRTGQVGLIDIRGQVVIWNLVRPSEKAVVVCEGKGLNPLRASLAWSEDGTFLAIGRHSLMLFDATSLEKKQEWPIPDIGDCHDVGLSTSTGLAVAVSTGGTLGLWDIQRDTHPDRKRLVAKPSRVRFAKGGNRASLITKTANTEVSVVSLKSLALDTCMVLTPSAFRAFEVSPCGRWLMTLPDDPFIEVFDLLRGDKVAHIALDSKSDKVAAVGGQSPQAAFLLANGGLVVRDFASGESSVRENQDAGEVNLLEFSRSGSNLACLTSSGVLRVFDVESKSLRATCVDKRLKRQGVALCVSEDGMRVFYGSLLGLFYVDMRLGKCTELGKHVMTSSVCLGRDESQLVAFTIGRSIQVWSTDSEMILAQFELDFPIVDGDCSSESDLIVAVDSAGTSHVFSLQGAHH